MTSKRNGLAEPTRRDVPAMCEIFTSGQIYHHDLFPKIFCAPDNQEKIQAYIGGFLKPRNPWRARTRFARAWFSDDVLQGYMLYQLHKSSDVFFGEDRWFAHVEDIAVGAQFRRTGAGSKLMAALTDEITALGGGVVSGQVWGGNVASETMFERSGFEATAKHFYRVI